MIINLRTLHANTGASTLAYNGGGALAIDDQAGSALVFGAIPAGNVLLQYQASGTTWRLLNAIKPATAGTADYTTNGMTQATPNSAANTVSVSVGTSGTAFQKTPVTIDPSTGAIGGSPSTEPVGVFNCSSYATLNSCLDVAKAYVTSNESGSGLAARVLIPQGTFSLSSPPYTIASGMQLVGVMPRLQNVSGQAPDLSMIPNGGTWIDCGASVCFTGLTLSGVTISGLGFKNFTKALSFGADSTKGLSFSTLQNLVAVGNSTVNSSQTAWELFNCQHVNGQFLNAYKVNVGLDFIQQDNAFQYGNSMFSEVYTLTYPKSASSGNNTLANSGMLFEVRTPGSGTAQALSYVDVYRPQVNAYGGDGTGYLIGIVGLSAANAVGVNLYDVDTEGTAAYGIYLNYEANSFVSLTQGAGTNMFYQAANGGNSTIVSQYNAATVYNGTGTNVYYGQYAAQASPNSMRGSYWLNSPYGFWVQADGVSLGAATATTPSVGDNTTKVATTAFVAGAVYPVVNTTVVVGSGTQGANSCSSTTNVTMTGLATPMTVLPGYSAAPTTYWAATGGMVFQIWPSAPNTATWQVCNQTSASITYPAITFNVGAR